MEGVMEGRDEGGVVGWGGEVGCVGVGGVGG